MTSAANGTHINSWWEDEVETTSLDTIASVLLVYWASILPHNPELHLQGFNQVRENKNILI